eukprot:scpid82228/ scgid21762/ Centlein; Centrosomal protein
MDDEGASIATSNDERMDELLSASQSLGQGLQRINPDTLSKAELKVQLAECMADKEFVWTLWRELQSSAPDKTKLAGLIVTREKEKANQRLQKMMEEVGRHREESADMVQSLAVLNQEVEAAHAREADLKRKLTMAHGQLTSRSTQSANSSDISAEKLKPQLADAKEHIKMLTSQLAQATAHSELLAMQLNEHSKSGMRQADEIVQHQLSMQKMQTEIKMQKESHKALESHSERVLSEAVAKLEAFEADSTAMRASLQSVSQERDDLREKLAKLDSESRELKSVLRASASSHGKERERLKQALEEQQQHSLHDQKRRRRLRDQLVKMQDQLAKIQQQQQQQ